MEVLSRAGIDRNEKVLIDGERLSIYYVLKYRKDIVKIEPGLFDLVNPQQATGALRQALANPQARKAYCDEHHLFDLLAQGSVRLTADQLASNLRALAPRLYSISSSPKAHPGEVHLTVDVLRYQLHGVERRGVASNFIADLEAGSRVGVYVNPTKEFTLCDPSAPMIMIGPGTGIAPFRAMLEEREATNAPGKSWLFFGAQRSALDFLYREQLDGWVRSGRLSQLDCAWSRDQEYKVYVQDLMYHHSQGIWRWLEAGAYVYVCGDAKRMAKDVHNTLLRIIAEQGRLGEQGAEEYMSRFKAEKRYRRDVY
jgi:sulfite reductase (NADPH) flavoprotein alpha-component